MGNSLRCCLACVIPCGALDLIRIVHLNGHIEEIMHPTRAGEVLNANPNHVLTNTCSEGVVRRILIVSPESELKRGSIYFLIPKSSLPAHKNNVVGQNHESRSHHKVMKTLSPSKKSKKCCDAKSIGSIRSYAERDDHALNIVSGKKSSRMRDLRSNHGRVWMPQLESISEDL